ncbi:MAG: hypothetical protein LLF78_06640 [Synergistaceae bacterium]|nr:hypothetical protein [Synergistaceae bacterium]
MLQQFEQIENAIGRLENMIAVMKRENEELAREVHELKGIIDDRDLEILQLQEEAQKRASEDDSEKNAIKNRLEGLLGRVIAIAPEEKKEENSHPQG